MQEAAFWPQCNVDFFIWKRRETAAQQTSLRVFTFHFALQRLPQTLSCKCGRPACAVVPVLVGNTWDKQLASTVYSSFRAGSNFTLFDHLRSLTGGDSGRRFCAISAMPHEPNEQIHPSRQPRGVTVFQPQRELKDYQVRFHPLSKT